MGELLRSLSPSARAPVLARRVSIVYFFRKLSDFREGYPKIFFGALLIVVRPKWYVEAVGDTYFHPVLIAIPLQGTEIVPVPLVRISF